MAPRPLLPLIEPEGPACGGTGVPELLAKPEPGWGGNWSAPACGCGIRTATVLVVDDERKIRDTVRAGGAVGAG
jgi:hypothetical protein